MYIEYVYKLYMCYTTLLEDLAAPNSRKSQFHSDSQDISKTIHRNESHSCTDIVFHFLLFARALCSG